MEVFYYINQLQFSIVRKTALSYDLLYFCLPAGCFTEVCVIVILRGCDEGHWHAHTRGLPWDLPEVIGMVQQVHCIRRILLQRGLELHVCTINKSAHTKKVWKLIVCTSYIWTHKNSSCKKKKKSLILAMNLPWLEYMYILKSLRHRCVYLLLSNTIFRRQVWLSYFYH